MDLKINRTAKSESELELRLLLAFERLGLKPKQQYPISVFFADFCFPEHNLVVEVDGHEYHQDKQREKFRTDKLKSLGWTVEKYPGWAVWRFADAIAAKILLKHFKDSSTPEKIIYAQGAVATYLARIGEANLSTQFIENRDEL